MLYTKYYNPLLNREKLGMRHEDKRRKRGRRDIDLSDAVCAHVSVSLENPLSRNFHT